MSLEPERDFYSLLDHDLTNIYSCASSAVDDGDYRNHWIQGCEGVMNAFVNDLERVIDDLDVGEDERPDLDSGNLDQLTQYDPGDFHPEFRRYVGKVEELAGLAMDCVNNFERSQDYERGWVKISDVFAPFDGSVGYNEFEDYVIRGDGSLACIMNTLEHNSYNHGGEDVNTYAVVNPGWHGTFNKHLTSSREETYSESEDRWVEADTERAYKILVWDDGEGVDVDDREELFDDSGLGLTLTQKLIHYFEGEITLPEDHRLLPNDAGFITSITLPGKKVKKT